MQTRDHCGLLGIGEKGGRFEASLKDSRLTELIRWNEQSLGGGRGDGSMLSFANIG